MRTDPQSAVASGSEVEPGPDSEQEVLMLEGIVQNLFLLHVE